MWPLGFKESGAPFQRILACAIQHRPCPIQLGNDEDPIGSRYLLESVKRRAGHSLSLSIARVLSDFPGLCPILYDLIKPGRCLESRRPDLTVAFRPDVASESHGRSHVKDIDDNSAAQLRGDSFRQP